MSLPCWPSFLRNSIQTQTKLCSRIAITDKLACALGHRRQFTQLHSRGAVAGTGQFSLLHNVLQTRYSRTGGRDSRLVPWRVVGVTSWSSGQLQRFKSSDAWLEKPVVFRTTTPASSAKQRGERGGSKKVSKVPRPRTKKPSRLLKGEEMNAYLCTAFTTAEEYNLEHLSFDLQIQGNKFCLADMPQDAHDILHVQLSDEFYEGQEVEEPGEMFFFREGSVVFWNVPDPEIKLVMRIVGRHQHQPYEIALVNWENEQMNFSYHDQPTSLVKSNIILDATKPTNETALEKFAFSNAMALSVKLAIWEYSLDQFVASIENIPENMKLGKGVKLSRQEVMKKTGELFALRHRINLSSDLLISPDFYWDREELELIYNKMCQFLSISRRTNVMNEKLNHCTELVELMRTHLEEKHSHRLEWMIIILIMVEVLFEIIHYVRVYRADDKSSIEATR